MSVGLIAAGALAAYAFTRMRATDDTDEVDEELLDAADDGAFDELMAKLAGDGKIDVAYFGPMLVTVKLKVSGIEKFFSKESTLKKAAVKFVADVQRQLPSRCPGAPKIVGSARVKFKDVDGGYKISVTWPAQWSHTKTGALRPVVTKCLLKIMRENKDVGARVKSLTAVRLS